MQQKQKELLQALYVEHRGVLRIAAYKYGLSQAEAEDAVQDTFCSFMEMYLNSADEWNDRQIKAALMRILRNRCMDYFRSVSRHPKISIQEFMEGDEYRQASEFFSADIAGVLAAREDMARLREGVLSMSLAMQAVVVLYMLEERPIKEVCRILNVSEKTCRMRIFRARRYLSKWMKDAETTSEQQKKQKDSSEPADACTGVREGGRD